MIFIRGLKIRPTWLYGCVTKSVVLGREGDEIHLVHVVPKLQMGACFGAPPVDFLPQQDPIAYDQLVKQAEAFIQMRFLPSLNSLRVHPIVHIVKVLTQACVASHVPWSMCQ